MKLLLILFVLLTVLSTLCTGRTISRELCEKIISCKQRYLSTPVTTQELVLLPQNYDNIDSPLNDVFTRSRHSGRIMDGGLPGLTTCHNPNSRPNCALGRPLLCPCGVSKLASGRCAFRKLCEKMISCKQRYLPTPVPTQRVRLPQNDDNIDCSPQNKVVIRSRHSGRIMDGGLPDFTTWPNPDYLTFETPLCPGGAYKLASGRCADSIYTIRHKKNLEV